MQGAPWLLLGREYVPGRREKAERTRISRRVPRFQQNPDSRRPPCLRGRRAGTNNTDTAMGAFEERQQRRREAIIAECVNRGIKIEQRNQGYLLRGAGVHLLAADLSHLDSNDLKPIAEGMRHGDR